MFKIPLTSLLVLLSLYSSSQYWETVGNSGINPAINFIGTIGSINLNLSTNSTPLITIGGANGYIGVGITNPLTKLHLEDGAFLINGSLGANPNTGAGTKLLWIPEFKALRAGEVSGSQWDGLNLGTHSLAIGLNNTASCNFTTLL